MKHYVLCQHGFMGSRIDFQTFVAHLDNAETIIVPLVANEGKTLDGVEKAGNRCLTEIVDFIQSNTCNESVFVSVLGHSMGGLILRFALREICLADPEYWTRNHVTLKLAIFIATPHTGVPTQMPLIQTGADLALKSPILMQISDEYGQSSLNAFQNGVVLYGNLVRDKFVSAESALICAKVHAVQAGDACMIIAAYEVPHVPHTTAIDTSSTIRELLNTGVKNIKRFLVQSPPAWPQFLQRLDNSAHGRIIAHGQLDRAKVGMPMIHHLANILIQ